MFIIPVSFFIRKNDFMKNNSINIWVRMLVLISGLLLVPVIFLPMWRIELDAPQYPEGLTLKIYPGKLGGDVEIVNGLNHYIGMKTLHAEDFIEFTVLPYLIIFFAVLFVMTSLVNRRVLLYITTSLFMVFAVLAMADFWRWEYDYGHNLDPHAAIQVPGMSYQPPFLGYKQLLNFGAFSIPDAGGWIFFSVGILLFGATTTQIVLNKKNKRKLNFALLLLPLMTLGFSSCNSQPQPIKVGSDACHFCKMIISDNRFGAEILTQKGKVYKFDYIACLLDFSKAQKQSLDKAGYYFVEFEAKHDLLKSSESFLLKSDELKSPMNGNIAAFSSKQKLETALSKYKGQAFEWNELLK
jgi:copper chaperone NosL